MIPHLPQGLSRLDLEWGDFYEANDDDIAMLSRQFSSKLVHLTIDEFVPRLIMMLPTHLQSLAIAQATIRMNRQITEYLPRSLTYFESQADDNDIVEIDQVFKALPRTLITLFAVTYEICSELGPELTKPIPTPSDSSLHLPRCMERLEIGCLDFSESNIEDWILGLPTTLTSLRICVNRLQGKFLTPLRNFGALKELSLSVWNSPECGWAQSPDCKALPRTLTSLRIFDSSPNFKASDITNDCFMGAPFSLTQLRIPNSPLLTSRFLSYLPNLTAYWIRTQNSK